MTWKEYVFWFIKTYSGQCAHYNWPYSWLWCLMLVFLLASCKTTQYVPVETVRTEYKSKTDTVIEKDTVLKDKTTIIREADSTKLKELGLQLKENEKAILILQKELERQVYNKIEVSSDTVLVHDSIQVPYPVPAQLTQWQKFYCDYGKIMLGVTLACIIGLLIFITEWLRKRIP